MQIWKNIKVTIEGKTCEVKTLFDSGSSFIIIGHVKLKELFGKVPTKPLVKLWEGALANGQKIVIDSYVDSEMTIDKYMISERIYLSKDIAKKVELEGKEVGLPELIIGSPTMETWGLELDFKRGEMVYRGSFIL